MTKKLLLSLFVSIIFLGFLSGCGKKHDTWQGAHYDGWLENSNIVQWPIFTSYEWCKDWAIEKISEAFNGYTFCSKNCHDSIEGMPICEDVVRSWAPLPISVTFDNYKP